jgi:hypothetical protein
MMTRRGLFEEVGGFREEAGSYFDVDYCLRVTGAGCRVVFTPHARLVHSEWRRVAPGIVDEDAGRMRAIWGDRVAKDPFYNANFSRNTPDYEPDLSAVVPGTSR